MKVNALGYVGVGASDVDAWRSYATDVLGHEVAYDSDDKTLYLRMDEHHHRLVVEHDDSDDVAYVGWEVADQRALGALAAQVEAAGVEVLPATPDELARRRVLDLVHFREPHSGVRTELYCGPEIMFNPPFRPQRPLDGFRTGDLGLGHVLFNVADPEAAARFYVDVLGFGVSDWIVVPGMGKLGAFLHCNARHHSVAFMMNPQPRKLTSHVMLEHLSIDDVGRAIDICNERQLVSVQFGRHANDRMLSFYFKNPSGWNFELGWGAREIDPDTWQVEHYNALSPGGGEWGHQGLMEMG